jgi:hypothetical protein
MKGARPDPDPSIATVPGVAVSVDKETLAGHDGMLGARVRWIRRLDRELFRKHLRERGLR